MSVSVLPILRAHWWVNAGLLSPFGSVMPEVSAVRVLPTARTPLTAGRPPGLALGGLTTVAGGAAGEGFRVPVVIGEAHPHPDGVTAGSRSSRTSV